MARFFKNCSPKRNIVAPMKEDDCEMVQGSSQATAKIINKNNIIDVFTVACSSGKSYEEFEEEQEVRSQTNFIRVRSNESTDEFDDDEEFFADAELSLDSENSDISDSFSSMSLPILSSEQINDDSASNDDHVEIRIEPTIQCSTSEQLELDIEEDIAISGEQLVDASSSSEALDQEYLKEESLKAPQEEEIVVSDGDLSIDDLINDLLQSPALNSCVIGSDSGSSTDLDRPGLESGSSSGISCTFDSTTSVGNTDDVCVPGVEVASVFPADHQDTEADAAETDASVADATNEEKTQATSSDEDEDTASKTDAALEPEATSGHEEGSRESLSVECPLFKAKDATKAADAATSDDGMAIGTITNTASDLPGQNEGFSDKDLSLDNEAEKGFATEAAVASFFDPSIHHEQSNSDEASMPECQSAEESLEKDDNVNTTEGLSSLSCIEQEECGSLDSWSTEYLLNKANDDYADDSFESYTEEDHLSADEASSSDYNKKDRLKNREDDSDEILTPEEVREIIASAKERLYQATYNVKSILKVKGNSSKYAIKNVRFAEYHRGPAYRQKASGDNSYNHCNSKNENEQTDSKSVEEMITAAKQRLNFAADKVKDYVTGEGPRFQSCSAENDAETGNNIEAVEKQVDVSNAVKSLENSHEDYAKPESPVGIRKANSFTMFIPSGETSALQRRNRHLFFQGKKHERDYDEYDPYTDIDDHANEIYDQLNFDTYADSEAFSIQHGQESSVLEDSRTELHAHQ